MRFIQTLPFLAAFVSAQQDVVAGVFSKISTDVTALDTAIKGFTSDGTALTGASTTLISDINSGTSTIQGSQPLDITGASGIVSSVTGLSSTIDSTITDLIAKKSAIVAAGLGGTVYQSLLDQQTASKALSDAVTAKTPTALQSTAATLSQGILDAIGRGVTAFQDQAGSTGPASSAPASSSAAATGSSSAVASSTAATKPTTAVGTATSSPATTPTSKSGTYSTTKAAPPASFTGAANVQGPMIGFAVAAAGLVAAL